MFIKKYILLSLVFLIVLSTMFISQTNAGVFEIAKEYASYEWTATKENVEHEVYTHFNTTPYFKTGQVIKGVAYAWWRCDSVAEFETGIKNGKAGGLRPVKTKEGDDLWCAKAAGTDCSGFITQLWNLGLKHSTRTLISEKKAARIPIWDAKQNDVFNSASHVMWISDCSFSESDASFNGYHASSSKGRIEEFISYSYSYFTKSSFLLFRKGQDPGPPKVEITGNEISKRNNKNLKVKISDEFCGEASVRVLMPDLTSKILNDKKKYYQYPKDNLCYEGIKLPKTSALYERELEIFWSNLAQYFSISSSIERYCDGEYEFIIKTKDLNPTTVEYIGNDKYKFVSPGEDDYNEEKVKLIINNYKPEVHKCTIEYKGTSEDPAKIDDLVTIKIDFTEEIKEGSNPKIEIEVEPGQFKTLVLEGATWNDNTIGGVKIKHSSFKAQARIPQHQQSPSSQLEKKLRISGVSGLGTDDNLSPVTVTLDGQNIVIYADLDEPRAKKAAITPAKTYDQEPQTVRVSIPLEDFESGIQSAEFEVEGKGTFPAHIYYGDVGLTVEARCQFQSHQVKGSYKIWLVTMEDKAGNVSKKTEIGTLTVLEKPDSDKHANPDESLDLFGPTLTGNQAPRFGPAKIAIFKAGYAVELSDLLATFGEAADYIPPENFSPALASTYPILVIPSAGLANQTNNASLRDKLTEYVENGGNLIVMTQPTDECYQLLPDKVESLGYFQDKACYSSTAGIRKYTPALAGQSDATLDGTADGVIISWPENAETWLYRLKNNFPALISYQCGKGRVIVSNYYSDYAHGHSQLHRDEKALMRDLLSWGRDFGEIPEVKPGEMRQVAVPVHFAAGGAEGSIAQVRLILRNPDRKIFSTQEIPLEITVGETKNVSFDFNDADQSLSKNSLGIWWLNYELLGADGKVIQAEREGQRVALSKGLEGTTQKSLAVTVDAPVTTALEGTKIPFKVIARNEGDRAQNVSLKVYAVLYTLVSQVQEETQVYSESISINPHNQADLTIELLPFKAYTSTGGHSWDKNWWRFVFTDENGKEIITESRGVSVYRPAAKADYKFRNLTNPDAAVFKPGDQVCLELTIENLVPVGYPVDWEVRVKAKNQDRIVHEQSGNAILDPVITPYQVFTVPEDLQFDTYEVELAVKHNGAVIPLVFGESRISTREISNLVIDNYTISLDGLTLDLTNPNDLYTDYTILIRVYDESRKLVLQDYQSGGINGKSTVKIETPYSGFAPCIPYQIEGFYLTFPTTHGNWFYHTIEPGQGSLQLKIKSVSQESDNKKLFYNLEIENPGFESSGVQLRTFIKGINYSQKTSVPNLKTGEKTELTLEIPLPNGLEQGVYPVEFAFCYANDSEVLAYRHYPDIKLRDVKVSVSGILCNLANEGLLNADYKFVYKIYKSNLVVGEGEISGLLAASETKQHTITVNQFSPFNRYQVVGKLIYPSSEQEKYIDLQIEPLKVELNTPKGQTINGVKFSYDISLTNSGPEFSNLQLVMTLSHPALQRDFIIPPLATGATCKFKGELELPGELTPGTYNVNYYLANTNGEKFPLGSGSYTVLAPQIAVNPPAKSEFVPGESYDISIVNNGDISTKVDYEFQIKDGTGKIVATKIGSVELGPHQENNLIIPVDTNWISSHYFANWKLTTSPIRINIFGYKAFTLKGAETELTVATDQSIYHPDQIVVAHATLSNGDYPLIGSLDLAITRFTASGGTRIDGWPCLSGNPQRTGWAKLSGGITVPGVLWASEMELQNTSPLVGDLDGDGVNEVIFLGGTKLEIYDGVSGFKKREFEYKNLYPDFTCVTGALLVDIDNNKSQEVIVCLDNCFLAAFDAKLGVIWFKELTGFTTNSEQMTIADFNGDYRPELLLDGLLLDAGSGAVIKTGTSLGTVGDLNGDGKLEVVTQTAVLDSDFQTLAVRTGGTISDQFPILADLNHDGLLEILVFGPNGLDVYNHSYEPYWSVPTSSIHKVTVGDLDGDGYQEVVSTRLIETPSGFSFEINCFSNYGVPIWRKTEAITGSYITGTEYSDMVLNDVNGDGRLELITANAWSGVTAYNTRDGEALWNFIDWAEPEIIIADIDGDRESEVIVCQSSTYISIDNTGTVCKQEPRIVTAPLEKTDKYLSYRTFDTNHSQLFKLANGTLLTPGNQCISYYIPSTNQTGLIPLPGTNPRWVAFRETEYGVEIWDYDGSVLLGLLNPDTLQYSVKNIKKDFCPVYSPCLIRNNWYYYQSDGEIFAKNLDTGAVKSFGVINPSLKLQDIIAVIDDSILLVIANNYLGKLSLIDLTLKTLVQQPFTNGYRDALWLDETSLILKGASGGVYNEGLYQFNFHDNILTQLVTLEDLKNLINDAQIVRACNLEFAVRDSNNLYLTLEVDEQRSQYLNADYRYQPALYNYDLNSGALTKLTTFKEYGPLKGITQTDGKIYFMVSHPTNGVYCYDPSSGSTINYPLPIFIYQNIVEGRLNRINKMFTASDGKVCLWLESNLYVLDPSSGSWSEVSLDLGSNVYPFNMCFDSSSNLLYILASIDFQDKLIAYNLNSRSITELDSVDYNPFFENLIYDSSTNRLYYNLAKQVKYLEPETGKITEICEMSSEEAVMVNAKEDKIYFMYAPITLSMSPEYCNLNLWEYSINEGKFEILSSVSESDYKIIFEYWNFYGINLDGIAFNPDALQFYAASSDMILEFNLEKVEAPVSGNSIYDNTNNVYQEKTIAQKTLPVNLTAHELKSVTNYFQPIPEAGTYILKGLLVNDLGQELVRAQSQFVVSDNGLGLTATGDKRYYRPNENITLSGLLFNSTDIASGSLKFSVTRTFNGQTTILREEDLNLNPGEERHYTLDLYETVAGEYLFTVKLTQNGTVVAEARSLVIVAEPQVEVEFDLPQAVGSKPVSALVKLTNKSPYPVSLYAVSELMGLAEPVTLGANETVLFTKEFSVTGDAILLLNITGDVTANYQRTIIFNEKADLTINLPAQVPEGTKNIVYNLSNTGSVAAEFPIGLTLYRNGAEIAQYNTIAHLNPNQSLTGEWPVDLTPGDYLLVYSTLNQTKEFNFTCLPDYAATMTATSELTGLDELRININASNTGCNPILGVIKLESEFTEQSIPVEISSGASYSNVITLIDLPVAAGTYELKLTLEAMGMTLATQILHFTREETVPPAPEMVLTDIPINLTGGAGQELPVTVKVRNNGNAAGDCLVELSSEAITFSDATVINLAPGAEAEHTFKMIIPEELESGTYQGRIIINESVTHFQYQVNGYKLEAVASLDKAAYRKGETAILTIAVQNKGGQPDIPLTVRVKQGDFDETREITLGPSINLTYQIPIIDFNQKIFYGFYHSTTGRSLLLDVQNIYEAVPEFMAVPDRQRYQAGETVNFNIQVNEEGWLAVAGPNDFYRFELVKESISYAIPLPGDLRTGTYSIWATFAGKTLEYKIDVIGHDIRFASGKLDKTVYQNGEPFQLDTVVTSGESLNCTALVELVKPDGSVQSIATREAQLAAGENNLNFKGVIKSDQTGVHRIRVRFKAGDLSVSQNDYSFLFGKEELLGITCSEVEYFNGTEPVGGEIHLYGQGNGRVTLYLDGQMMTTLAADVNGNTVIPYQVSASNLKPGRHTLSAVYQGAGGKSGTVTTEFDYGTGLPDLTVSNINLGKERTNDGAIPIAVTIHKGNALPAKEIKVKVTLGNELIGEYVIPELSGVDAADTRTILWQAGEFNGAAELKATVNYDNRVREYDDTNNSAIANVAIPMVPEVNGLPELTNDPQLPISGQTTPEALVCLYDDRGMIDFGYADASGNFNLTDHYLNQGENRLRLKARNREGWESLFSEEFTIILDAAPPQIIINNLEDNRHYNYDLLPEITIVETDPAEIQYTLDGRTWVPGTAISAEGAHQLLVTVTDIAGNRTERLINFTIDKTPPEIVVVGVVDSSYYNTPQSPSVSVNDLNPVTTELTLNGEPYQGAAIEEDGDYLFEVLAYDQAGNTVTRQIGFTIDRTAPVIQISGVNDGETYQGAVTPVIEVIEANPEEIVILLNGQPFTSGTEINTTGNHMLSVTAVDKAGNQENVTIRFNLDSQFRFDHTILCNGLQFVGNVSVDRIFCNGEVKIVGNNIRIDYLGLAAGVIPDIGNAVIEKLETGLPVKAIPEPDWDGLTGATSLVDRLESGKVYSNIRYNGNLYFNGNLPKITGLFVVKGDLNINGNLDLKDLAIFCTGKINIMGNVKVNGLIYAKEMRVNGNLNLTGANLVSGTLVLNGDASCKSGDVQRYGQWLR